MNFHVRYFLLFWIGFVSFVSANEESKKQKMLADLAVLKHQFDIVYAPMTWKKQCKNWDFEDAYQEAQQKIISTHNITLKDFSAIIRSFTDSLHDYHVNVFFESSESATLPFTLTCVEDRFFVHWIDRDRLPESFFNINIGDELIEFDGIPIAQVIEELSCEIEAKNSNIQTDKNLVAFKLTRREGVLGDPMPESASVVTFESNETGKVFSYQLGWLHSEEIMSHPIGNKETTNSPSNSKFLSGNLKRFSDDFYMINPLLFGYRGSNDDNSIDGFTTFVPPLGKIIWSSEDSFQKGEEGFSDEHIDDSSYLFLFNPNDDAESTPHSRELIVDSDDLKEAKKWNAYIYLHPNGKHIGYIRISDYLGTSQDIENLGKIIKKMEEDTQALVIDQVNNMGGLVFFMYDIASMLITEPLPTHFHQIKLTYEKARNAFLRYRNLSSIEKLSMNDVKKNNLTIDSFQKNIFRKNYFKFIWEQWCQGKTLTDPIYLFETDRINPHRFYRYSKPIVILINEMDMSCADTFPALFQDSVSDRVKLFGTTTAGCGGCVTELSFVNNTGIDFVTYDFTISQRKDLSRIENTGVQPDVCYPIKVEDVKSNYKGYVNKLNETVDSLMKSFCESKPK